MTRPSICMNIWTNGFLCHFILLPGQFLYRSDEIAKKENREVLSTLKYPCRLYQCLFCDRKKAWAESPGIVHTPLVCDFWPHGTVAQQY